MRIFGRALSCVTILAACEPPAPAAPPSNAPTPSVSVAEAPRVPATSSAPSAPSATAVPSASAAPTTSVAAPAPPPRTGPKPNARVRRECGPTDGGITVLAIYDHTGDCNDALPGAVVILHGELESSGPTGGWSRIGRVEACSSAKGCEAITGATIRSSYDAQGDLVGEVTYSAHGKVVRVPFRAVSCPENEQLMCG